MKITDFEFVSPRAKELYEEISKGISDTESVDQNLLSVFANEMATYEHACEILSRDGDVFKSPNGYPQLSPYHGIRNTSLKNAMAIAKLFGFSPLARKQIGEKQRKKVETKFMSMTKNSKTA